MINNNISGGLKEKYPYRYLDRPRIDDISIKKWRNFSFSIKDYSGFDADSFPIKHSSIDLNNVFKFTKYPNFLHFAILK